MTRNYHGKAKGVMEAVAGKGSAQYPFTVYVSKNEKKWTYAVEDESGNIVFSIQDHHVAPSDLKKGNTEFFNDVIKEAVGDTGVSKDFKRGNVNVLKQAYKDAEEEAIKHLETAKEKLKERKVKTVKSYISKGQEVFNKFKEQQINVPRYIASVSRWLIAKEEANVIKVLLATMNTARGEATNIIQESASASGKSAIEHAGFSLVHDHHYIMLNYVTPASFRNLCIDDPYVFKNKVIRLGDLGNEINQEAIQEVMGVIKILNSEGRYEATKMHKNGEDQVHIVLEGRSAMCYSKVANDIIVSDQDSSRGILITPNPNNDEDFKKFMAWKSLPDLYDYQTEVVDRYTTEIKNYIEYLIQMDIEIVNPYMPHISEILENNKAYRRKLGKELWLIDSLALLNLPNKKIHQIEGKNVIFVSVEDLVNYMTLYKSDLIANSNYDISLHGQSLYEDLKEKYKPINDYRVDIEFRDELHNFGIEEYEDKAFRSSKKFFTITQIMDEYEGTKIYTNLTAEVKEEARRSKIRSTLNNMPDKIGKYVMSDQDRGSHPTKPNLYYIIKTEDTYIFNSVSITKDYLENMQEVGLGSIIPNIIEDFKTTDYQKDLIVDKDKISIVFDEDQNDILDHYECVPKPPTLELSEETETAVDSIWNDHFGSIIKSKEKTKYYRERKVDEND